MQIGNRDLAAFLVSLDCCVALPGHTHCGVIMPCYIPPNDVHFPVCHMILCPIDITEPRPKCLSKAISGADTGFIERGFI